MKTTLITGQLKHIVRTKRTREKKLSRLQLFHVNTFGWGIFPSKPFSHPVNATEPELAIGFVVFTKYQIPCACVEVSSVRVCVFDRICGSCASKWQFNNANIESKYLNNHFEIEHKCHSKKLCASFICS